MVSGRPAAVPGTVRAVVSTRGRLARSGRAGTVVLTAAGAVLASVGLAGCTDAPATAPRSVRPTAAVSPGPSSASTRAADRGGVGTTSSPSRVPSPSAVAPLAAVAVPTSGAGTVETWASDEQGFVESQLFEDAVRPGRRYLVTVACASADRSPQPFLVGVAAPVGFVSRARFTLPCDRRRRAVAWTAGSAGDVQLESMVAAASGTALRWAAALSRASAGASTPAVVPLADAVAPIPPLPVDPDHELTRDGQLPGLDGSLGDRSVSGRPATAGERVVIDASCAADAGEHWPVTVSSGGSPDGAPALHEATPAALRVADASVDVPCDGRRHRWAWRVPLAGQVQLSSSRATVADPRGMLAVVRDAGAGDTGLPVPVPGDVLASTPAPAATADELARSTSGAASQSGVLRRGASYRVTASCDRTAAAVSLRWALTDLGAAPEDGGGSLFGGPGASDGSGAGSGGDSDSPGADGTNAGSGDHEASAFRTGAVDCDGRSHAETFLSPVEGPVGLVGDAAADGGWWLVLTPSG